MWIEIWPAIIARLRQLVTPHAGVWIEMHGHHGVSHHVIVTPHAGVWIEMSNAVPGAIMPKSLPTRECGLKYQRLYVYMPSVPVTPHAGVWIEML